MTKTLILDTETNGLTGYTRLWCVVTYCVETKEWRVFDYAKEGYIEDLKAYINDATTFVMHNGIEYDRYVLAHFTGLPILPVNKINDTLVRSRLYNSGREGGHSLERYGKYFHIPKVQYEDWETYHPDIVTRCKVDVEITRRVYEMQKKEGKNVSSFAIQLEENFVDLLAEMKRNGFPVDIEGIERSLSETQAKFGDIKLRIQSVFRPRAKRVAEISPKITKSGEYAKNTQGFKALEDKANGVQGPFTLIEWEEFNIGSSKQVVERMNEYGWQPVEFTKGGKDGENPQPKVSPANLETLPEDAPEEAQLISEYLKLETRIGLMENWIANYSPDTQRIHGSIIHIGAITHRCSHNNPNTGNIPNSNGGEIRVYWGHHQGSPRRLVGVDAKGIQLRILAHLTAAFTKDNSFMDAVLHGDPHTQFTLPIVASVRPELVKYSNEKELHEVKQKKTKRFIYAWLLGAGALKVGTIFGGSKKDGKAISDAFVNEFPGLKELKEYLAECARKGWWPAPDGRYIPIKSEHFALSVALQGLEAVEMKLAGILWRKEARKRGLDAQLVAFVHDEYVIDSSEEHAQEVGEVMCWAIAEAGKILRLRCPMEGDMKVGYNWLEVH